MTHCYNIDVLPLSCVVQFDLLLFSVFSMMMLVKKFTFPEAGGLTKKEKEGK